jgi:ComF family protein
MAKRRANRLGRRAEIDHAIELPQHSAQPLGEVGGDAIQQERFKSARERTALPGAKQCAIENQWTLRHVERTHNRRYRTLMETAATVPPSRLARASSRLARIAGGLRGYLRRTLDVALPPLCPACRDLVTDNGVCANCWSKLSFIAPPYCPRLGIPFVYDPGPGILSMQAIADPPAFQRARAAVRYDDVAKQLVHAFKYSDRLDLAPMLGRWMARAGTELTEGADALVPVPLHWRRLWTRRFNQSAALAEAIARKSGVGVAHYALQRVKATAQQVGLSRKDRAANVSGAFRVAPDAKATVAGRRLVLVDDVLTSGATVGACARALLRGGAAQVDVLVFARVVDPGKAPI